jgi:hypothetical protein
MRLLHVAGRAFGAPLLLAPLPSLAMLESLGAYVRCRGIEGAEADILRLKAWDDDAEPRGPQSVAAVGVLEYCDKAFLPVRATGSNLSQFRNGSNATGRFRRRIRP